MFRVGGNISGMHAQKQHREDLGSKLMDVS